MNDLMPTLKPTGGAGKPTPGTAKAPAAEGAGTPGFLLFLDGQVAQQAAPPAGLKEALPKQGEADAETAEPDEGNVLFAGFMPEETTRLPTPPTTAEGTPQAGQAEAPVAEPEPGLPFPLRVLPRPLEVEPQPAATAAEPVGVAPAQADSAPRAPLAVQPEMPLPQPGAVDERTVRFEELVERFDRRLLSMVQRNEKVTRITVQPASMGRLTVSCTEERSGLHIEIVAQSAGVREAIALQEDAIRRIMQEHSVELGGFDVLLDEGGGGRHRTPDGHEAAGLATARGTEPASNNDDGEPHAPQPKHKGGAVSLIA